jgi:ribosome-binding protein aMBF1 (putative translation factor)
MTLLFTILTLSVGLPLAVQPQQQESLGDVARQLRQQHDKDAKKAAKVFTNDNLPEPKFGEAVSSSPGPPENPAAPAPTTSKPASAAPSEETGSKPPAPPEDKVKTRDYWQAKFKAARQDLAKAKELQQLSEDELNLLQIQQARELDTMAKEGLTAKVQAKQSEVDIIKATTDAAQKALDDLEKIFKDSGAPEDWSQTEQLQGPT